MALIRPQMRLELEGGRDPAAQLASSLGSRNWTPKAETDAAEMVTIKTRPSNDTQGTTAEGQTPLLASNTWASAGTRPGAV